MPGNIESLLDALLRQTDALAAIFSDGQQRFYAAPGLDAISLAALVAGWTAQEHAEGIQLDISTGKPLLVRTLKADQDGLLRVFFPIETRIRTLKTQSQQVLNGLRQAFSSETSAQPAEARAENLPITPSPNNALVTDTDEALKTAPSDLLLTRKDAGGSSRVQLNHASAGIRRPYWYQVF